MKRAPWVLVVVLAAGSARADKVASTSLTIDEKDLTPAFLSLSPQLDEPVGLLAVNKTPKLGLDRGDIVLAINGATAARGQFAVFGFHASVLYLDVLRGNKKVVVRIAVKLQSCTDSDERDALKERFTRMSERKDRAFGQVTRDGVPSGVLVRDLWVTFDVLREGDIIRKVDGAAVDTIDHMITAVGKAIERAQFSIEVERAGQRVVCTVQPRDPPPQDSAVEHEETRIEQVTAQITKIDDATYELPRSVVTTLLDTQSAGTVSTFARVVPWVKDGKVAGFKFYAIRPGSPFAVLGVRNGDALKSLAGVDMTSVDQALSVFDKLRTARDVIAVFDRRGKEVTITYKIR